MSKCAQKGTVKRACGALCGTKKITPVEDTGDAGESDIDGAPLKECIRDKSMEKETLSFRFIYLK